MGHSNYLLALVIPTFNRAKYLDLQLAWAVESIADNWDRVELLVCDNASTDETSVVCDRWKKILGSNIKIFKNNKNVGLVNNCLLSIERSEAKYVWVIGDDDPIDKSAVARVVGVIENYHNVDIIHINHRCISAIDDSVIIPSFYGIKEDFISQRPGSSDLTNLLQSHHTGGFMFITANVLKRHSAMEFIAKYPPEEDTLLAYPMFLNAGLSSIGCFYLISDCIIDCVYHQSSWSDKYFKVSYQEVPQTLIRLQALGLGRKAIVNCFNHQFRELFSVRDILYKLKKFDVKFFLNREFISWVKQRISKEKIKWQIQSR